MEQEKENHFLYQLNAIVSSESNPTLLNIGCLDAGLYTVANVLPTCRFFQTNGIPLEEMFEEQEQYISDAKTLFVLARDDYPECIWKHYELISQVPYEWAGYTYTYYLFRRTS